MALKMATRTGGDFLDLRDLAADGAQVVVFRIVEFLPGTKGDFGPKYDVVADALICTGERKGEVHLAQTFIGAPTNTLRGVTAKASAAGEEPTNSVGDEIVCRVELVQRGKQPEFVALNVPSSVEADAAMEVYADGAGWAGTGEDVKVPAQAGAGQRPF